MATEPTDPQAGVTTLIFTPDNPCDTTITSAFDNSVLYRVKTTLVKRSKATVVYDGHGAVIGSLEWRDTLPDKVKIKDGQPMSLSSWLKKSSIPFSKEMSIKDDENHKYTWKAVPPGRTLELYAEKTHAPIATYSRTATGERGSMRPIGQLALLPRALEIQNLVVLSLLFKEKQSIVKYGDSTGADFITGVMLGETF